MAGEETEGESVSTITASIVSRAAVEAGDGGAAAMEEDEVEMVESEGENDERDSSEGGIKRLSADRDVPVANGCFSLTKIAQLKAEWAVRGPPSGYAAVVPWPEGKAKELQPYGIILRKEEGGVDVYYFFCLVTALSVKEVKVAKIATEGLKAISTSNAWRTLNQYGVYSQRGGARKDNKNNFGGP